MYADQLHTMIITSMVQGETGAMPGREAVGKPHRSDVKPIKKHGDEIQQDGKPVKDCASKLQHFEKPVKNCTRIIGVSLSKLHTSRTSVQSRYILYNYYVVYDLPYTIADQNCISYTHIRHGHFPHIHHYSAGTGVTVIWYPLIFGTPPPQYQITGLILQRG